jgi:hypothetical protein
VRENIPLIHRFKSTPHRTCSRIRTGMRQREDHDQGGYQAHQPKRPSGRAVSQRFCPGSQDTRWKLDFINRRENRTTVHHRWVENIRQPRTNPWSDGRAPEEPHVPNALCELAVVLCIVGRLDWARTHLHGIWLIPHVRRLVGARGGPKGATWARHTAIGLRKASPCWAVAACWSGLRRRKRRRECEEVCRDIRHGLAFEGAGSGGQGGSDQFEAVPERVSS